MWDPWQCPGAGSFRDMSLPVTSSTQRRLKTPGDRRGRRMTNGDLRVLHCHFCVWVGPVSGSEDLKRVGWAGER